MPSIAENRKAWSSYDWSQKGDEWSQAWGGSDFLWWGTILPRIRSFVPTGVILEIAPGYGRCSHYLREFCRQLILVDLNQNCIEACRQRFADDYRLSYHVNDGRSLTMIPDGSVDFVFSFDSLVHAEADVMQSYLTDLARKLKPDGWGFIHHSNIGRFVDPDTGQLPFANDSWRATSMTAEQFVADCRRAELYCPKQEIINWGGSQLTDCFSIIAREPALSTDVTENDQFMAEAAHLARLAYGQDFELRTASLEMMSSQQIARQISLTKMLKAMGLRVRTKLKLG